MKRALPLVALLLLALLATFAAQEPGSGAPTPSSTNRGPRGLAVLAAWLAETGAEALPSAGTVVLAAPSPAEVTAERVEELRAFVEGGGTLVYLVPRDTPQPALNAWLGVRPGGLLPLNNEAGDVGGSTVRVTGVPGVQTLRLSADRAFEVDGAQMAAEHGALWRLDVGTGQVWISAGADLAENARLELADNARFWRQLPAPVSFDEAHFTARVVMPVNLVATFAQLVFLALLVLWARGVRLGPPRDALPVVTTSAFDQVRAMARMLERAKLHREIEQRLASE